LAIDMRVLWRLDFANVGGERVEEQINNNIGREESRKQTKTKKTIQDRNLKQRAGIAKKRIPREGTCK